MTAAFSFSTPITGDTTLYAKWTTNNYSVTFNSNGGSAVASQSVPYNSTATAPTAPTKTGYSFAGWYSDAGLTAAFNFTTPITADTTLYAKWTTNNYSVTFNSNGGAAVASQSVTYNTVATEPTAPTKTGNTFAGWYSDAGLTAAFNFATPITADTTLYAKWTTNNYSVTFNSNGGTAVTSQSVPYNGTATTPTAPTKTGYSFAGWYSDAGLTAAFNFTTPITADTTLYAKWTINQSTVTLKFVAGDYGNIIGTKNQTVNYGGSSQVRAVAYFGFHFLNWTGTNGFVTTSTNPLIVSNATASQTITANFVPDHLLVTFFTDGHGSISGSAIQIVDYGGNTSSVTARPATGYYFVNWTGSNNFVSTNQTLTLQNVTTIQIIKANFAPNQYTLNFSSGAGGTITGTTPQTVNYGSNATAITAVPNAGYRFVNWTGDNGFYTTSANPLTVRNVKASQNITANFAPIPTQFTVTFVAGAHGSISGTKVQTVDYDGSTTSVTARPDRSYRFMRWTGNNGFVSYANPLKLSHVKADQTITAVFGR